MKRIFNIFYYNGWIIVITLIAFFLRIKNLDHQSLWLDELHTMNEADPSISWGELFHYLKCCDQHPALYFIVEKIAFIIFGHTSFVARFTSVIAGTISIYAMYMLGKEILNKNLGIICAILTAVNFYNIYYSQEARPYIFAFLFAALSFTWFIRLIKSPARNTAIYYSIFTLLLLYSHYYSLFVVASQAILALIFIYQESGRDRKIMFGKLLLSAVIVGIVYAPWLVFLQAMSQIKSFWIQDIPQSFLQDFFFGYFGNSELLKPLLLILLFIFFARVATDSDPLPVQNKKVKERPLVFGFIIIITWVFTVLLIPYIRSLLVVPMLYPRYTIVILPAVILTLAYGIWLFKNALIRNTITVLFLVISLIHLLFVTKYYKEINKTQFREMTQYVVQENTSNFPIVNEHTAWHQGYYLKLFSSKAPVITIKKEDFVDSVLSAKSKAGEIKGFWLVGAQHETMLADSVKVHLQKTYVLTKQKVFYDAWAQLYISKITQDSSYTFIHYNEFKAGEGTVLANEKQIAIWSGAIHSNPLNLIKGNYIISVSAMGTKADNVYPHVNIYINGKKIGDYSLSGSMEEKDFDFDNALPGNAVLTIEMDNDLFSPTKKEDRNVFIGGIVLHYTNAKAF